MNDDTPFEVANEGRRIIALRPSGRVDVNPEATRDELVAAIQYLAIFGGGARPLDIDPRDRVRDALIAAALALVDHDDTEPADPFTQDGLRAYDAEWGERFMALRRAAAAYRQAGGGTPSP